MSGSPLDNRTYGRRRGHRLRPARQALVDKLLPRLSVGLPATGVLDAERLKDGARELWLEIGFGAGEHLASLAGRHPEVRFIGCEPFLNGVASLLAQVNEQGLENILLVHGDARPLLAALPEACLSRVIFLFADPWPKKRHHKRRFVCRENLDAIARVLVAGGDFRFASDHGEYVRWTLARVLRHGAFAWPARSVADWNRRPADWPATRYEAKALAAGRQPLYFRFLRRQ
ncbi:MAG TPA: tRNA (guanosine(46)-N7)-methyltransferase TrmB [Alphaproteobacteria bacterium]|jgi:tRNA (guanine-N7-)-methyltransferase|nr:tRNA (guanosine(46)-N7)-methyltransferase TrmB [Alphaproteobacteria bacterium]MDP6271648.1 tRNA (guanosine(46)-N7)-methyltransferase TrmB [Alphaproteobacteria bacterium]MDP7164199.1 tRNA (guanosine(46)-N7)-methyltransferase TrmB [Alphaproteobacteria bacterium]MDP7426737.1 tRNA (guanosine(46)-N7)-methyltransferase TrmB [Alphaproteobacteria bacterium]HJM49959.1 tRNA (guanosine(46)-N7)-methyltransferase TrmB [Alphaproteobacteria bacterium]|tara:strand:+ start:40 stop:729 length:690 start_codon:yes stop_codon:yes gene_type:complete